MADLVYNYKRIHATDEADAWEKGQTLNLGFQTEKNARPMTIHLDDLVEKWPDAVPRLTACRSGEGASPYYPDGTTYADNDLVWTPDDYDTELEGIGGCQVLMLDEENEIVGWSEKIQTIVEPSLGLGGKPAEEMPVPWMQEMITAKEEALEAIAQGVEDAKAIAATLEEAQEYLEGGD